jgi:RHH-type proline utilization regulon transcriptional repressor/proline dehydrogenase/delta 1-pyrroline-5-carboxylate dehydrogenase
MATADEVAAAMARLHAGFRRLAGAAGGRARGRCCAAPPMRWKRGCPSSAPCWCAKPQDLGDCVAEVREAVDFCRYYADQAEAPGRPALPGPTGESNLLRLHGRGVFVCISPWNFPLAIFAGQVVAALVAGNTWRPSRPSRRRGGAALRRAAARGGRAGRRAAMLHGPGETVGAQLVAHPRTAGVCFTGSTAVARLINRTLAAKDGPIVPLIAETGGLNAMVVDSTALPEQVVDAVVQSAFRSAGQRCSALRLLCVHERIADSVIEMLQGAMAELRVGDPASWPPMSAR